MWGTTAGAAADPPARAIVADQPWPSAQQGLGLEADGFDAWTSAKAALPHAVVTPPVAAAPGEIKDYSGLWSGWMCPGRGTDLKVAFTRVGPRQATAVIAWAEAGSKPGTTTRTLSRVGDELRFDGADVLYKFRLRTPDVRVGVPTMDVMRVTRSGELCSGVLRKDAASGRGAP